MSQSQAGQSAKETFERLSAAIPSDLRDVVKCLPPEEIERYEAAQRSVTEAQRWAAENLGHKVIG